MTLPDPLKGVVDLPDAARRLESEIETYMIQKGTIAEYGFSACFRLALRMAKKAGATLPEIQQATADAWKGIPGTDKVLT